MILRKVWGSVWSRSSSGKDSASHSAIQVPLSPSSSSSLGAFDHLPMDILIQILMLVEPRDAVKLSLTCKAWRCLAGGNRLWIFYLQCSQESWDSIFFAETSLRSGYPLRMLSSQSGELSFMRIYGQRARVRGSIIIDGGSGYCKFGWSKYASPSGRSATFLNLCYVALDYKAELSRDTQASMKIAGEGWFTLSKERFQTGEILFQPRLAGLRAMSLHQAVALCMDHCDAAGVTGDDSWFKTVVLAGGSACLPGLAERLEKELHDHLPSYICNGVRVIPPPCGVDSAWHGAKLISNLSTFPGPWCITRKQFRRKSRLMW
ncbi:hypothetical protein F2Q70_00014917 [Brassica cretica]|uniref:F-box domain-containing protein n=1 Tax=Brassica cretica TaxID=69181 RepID=A0A8S9I1K8_BRACR|nr:hypothetical protein F2Q70_00014917 [Brassica cretica]